MSNIDAWSLNLNSGKYIRIGVNSSENLDEIVSTLPDGVYTTIRTYNHFYIFHLEDHLSRLKESLEISNKYSETKFNFIQSTLSKIISESEFKELRIRLHIPFDDTKVCIILAEELIPYPNEIYLSGVKVKTNQILRSTPKAKLTSFIQKASDEKKLIKATGLEESIITNDKQELLEGLSSNFFGVRKGQLFTADKGILSGITRKLVLEEAERAGIQINLYPVKITELQNLDEAFITSTSRGVMPVIQIDEIKIGNGKPGKLTDKIAKLFERRITDELESFSIP